MQFPDASLAVQGPGGVRTNGAQAFDNRFYRKFRGSIPFCERIITRRSARSWAMSDKQLLADTRTPGVALWMDAPPGLRLLTAARILRRIGCSSRSNIPTLHLDVRLSCMWASMRVRQFGYPTSSLVERYPSELGIHEAGWIKSPKSQIVIISKFFNIPLVNSAERSGRS